MSPAPDTLADPQQVIADLQCELSDAQEQLAECKAERDEALEQQTATAEVLQVIGRSTFDLTAALQIVVSAAYRLCQSDYSSSSTKRGINERLDTVYLPNTRSASL